MDFDKMYRDLLDETGLKYPDITNYFIYFSYKDGKVKEFTTFKEAKKFSSNIEEKVDKAAYQAAVSAYNKARSEAKAKVIQAMKNEICSKYGDNEQGNKLFDLAYRYAYGDDKLQSEEFNELYSSLLDYDYFIQQVLEIIKS